MFTDGSITNGNAHRPCSNLTASGLLPWNPKSGNEDFNSVIEQMAQVRLCHVTEYLASLVFLMFHFLKENYSFYLKITMYFVCLYW